jgi:hypothetical protein
LENLRKKEDSTENNALQIIKNTLDDLEKFNKLVTPKDLYEHITVTGKKSGLNLNQDEEMVGDFRVQLKPIDKFKVKQRIMNFKMNLYDQFDLKKFIVFWKSNILISQY